jgi:acid phosphatase
VAQLAWLEAALARSAAPLKIVFGHHTIYSGSPTHGDNPVLIETLKPILERGGVTAYICGHDHDLQHIRVGSIDYVCSGAGSEARWTGRRDGTLFAAAVPGFAAFSARPSGLDLTFVDEAGAVRYAAQIRTAAAASSDA